MPSIDALKQFKSNLATYLALPDGVTTLSDVVLSSLKPVDLKWIEKWIELSYSGDKKNKPHIPIDRTNKLYISMTVFDQKLCNKLKKAFGVDDSDVQFTPGGMLYYPRYQINVSVDAYIANDVDQDFPQSLLLEGFSGPRMVKESFFEIIRALIHQKPQILIFKDADLATLTDQIFEELNFPMAHKKGFSEGLASKSVFEQVENLNKNLSELKKKQEVDEEGMAVAAAMEDSEREAEAQARAQEEEEARMLAEAIQASIQELSQGKSSQEAEEREFQRILEASGRQEALRKMAEEERQLQALMSNLTGFSDVDNTAAGLVPAPAPLVIPSQPAARVAVPQPAPMTKAEIAGMLSLAGQPNCCSENARGELMIQLPSNNSFLFINQPIFFYQPPLIDFPGAFGEWVPVAPGQNIREMTPATMVAYPVTLDVLQELLGKLPVEPSVKNQIWSGFNSHYQVDGRSKNTQKLGM